MRAPRIQIHRQSLMQTQLRDFATHPTNSFNQISAGLLQKVVLFCASRLIILPVMVNDKRTIFKGVPAVTVSSIKLRLT